MEGDFDWTEASFDAAHKGQYADEVHGHTWNVRAYWPAEHRRDALEVHRDLVSLLRDRLCHRMLDGICEPTNVGVGRFVLGHLPVATTVEVWRVGPCPCGARVVRS